MRGPPLQQGGRRCAAGGRRRRGGRALQHGRADGLGDVGGVRAAARVGRLGGEADLVVDHHVQRAACREACAPRARLAARPCEGRPGVRGAGRRPGRPTRAAAPGRARAAGGAAAPGTLASCSVSATMPRPAKAASPWMSSPATRARAASPSRVCSARTRPSTTGQMLSRWLGLGAMLTRMRRGGAPAPACTSARGRLLTR